MNDRKELFNYIKEEAKKYGFKKVGKSFFGAFSYVYMFDEKTIHFNRRNIKKLSKFYNKEMQKKAVNFVIKHEKGHLLPPTDSFIRHKFWGHHRFDLRKILECRKLYRENRYISQSQANVNAAAKFYNSDDELIDELAAYCAWSIVEKTVPLEKNKIKNIIKYSKNLGLHAFNEKFIDKLAKKVLDNVERYVKDIDS